MANVHYKIIDSTELNIDGKKYFASTYFMSMQSLLTEFAGKEIYIYRESLCEDEIRAIVLDSSLPTWDEIHEEYSQEQYPPFGGPFTDALTPWEWLSKNFAVPKRLIRVQY